MPSGELMVGIAESTFVALQPDSQVREALLANLAPGESITSSDLPRVPTPAGGGRMWNWVDAGNNEQSAKEIVGALVYCAPRGTLWGSEDPQAGVSPVLVSYDLMTAVRVNDDIGDLDAEVLESCRIGDRQYDWRRLPYNKYGSASNGRGKRCKESRLLAILPEDAAWPLLISAGVGSLKTVVPFIKRLPVAHFQAVVSLSLDKVENAGGQAYSQIVPRLVRTLTQEEGLMLRRLYTEPLSRMAEEMPVSQDDA